MSKQLNDSQKSKFIAALDAFIDANEGLMDQPKYSTRADEMVTHANQATIIAHKIKAELDPSYAEERVKQKTQAQENQTDEQREKAELDRKAPGLSGHPEKKDDTERHGSTFSVDSTSHREIRAGDHSHTNADTLPLGTDPDSRLDPGARGKDQPNISHDDPNRPATLTSTDGASKPNNTFAEMAQQFVDAEREQDQHDDATRQSHLESRRKPEPGDSELAQKPKSPDGVKSDGSSPQKYDSENRVMTETLEHDAAKREGKTRDDVVDGDKVKADADFKADTAKKK